MYAKMSGKGESASEAHLVAHDLRSHQRIVDGDPIFAVAGFGDDWVFDAFRGLYVLCRVQAVEATPWAAERIGYGEPYFPRARAIFAAGVASLVVDLLHEKRNLISSSSSPNSTGSQYKIDHCLRK